MRQFQSALANSPRITINGDDTPAAKCQHTEYPIAYCGTSLQ
jgi:hypothetical protein